MLNLVWGEHGGAERHEDAEEREKGMGGDCYFISSLLIIRRNIVLWTYMDG